MYFQNMINIKNSSRRPEVMLDGLLGILSGPWTWQVCFQLFICINCLVQLQQPWTWFVERVPSKCCIIGIVGKLNIYINGTSYSYVLVRTKRNTLTWGITQPSWLWSNYPCMSCKWQTTVRCQFPYEMSRFKVKC